MGPATSRSGAGGVAGGAHEVPAQRDDSVRRLVAVRAAEVSRYADGAAYIAADLQRDKPCGQCSRRAAGGAAHRSVWFPWVPGQTVDVVVGLPVSQEPRDVGLAQDDGAGLAETFHRHRVGVRHVVAELRCSTGGDQAGRLEGILDGDRQTVKRTDRLANSQCLICSHRLRTGPLEVRSHHDVETRIQCLDARNGLINEFNGTDVAAAQRRNTLSGGPIPAIDHALLPVE